MPTPRNFPAHLSQLPAPVAATLAEASRALDAEDAALEAALLRSLRDTRLPQRIPVLADALKRDHPGMSTREVFRILEVKTGLSCSHIRDLYYRHRRELAACSW